MRRSRKKEGSSAARTWLGTEARVLRHVHVCGSGYLASATRVELARLGIHRDTDYALPSLLPPLVIACADSDRDESSNDVAFRAAENGSPLLLACLSGNLLRVGPLVEPRAVSSSAATSRSAEHAERSHAGGSLYTEPRGGYVAEAGPRLNLHARLGALLVCSQALTFLLGTPISLIRGRVVELNPWSMESKTYRVAKVRH